MDVGAELRASREAKGLSIEALARTTRVQPRILSAIELNNLSGIPPRPSGRSFVRSFAQEVGLDPDRTARDYFAQFAPDQVPESIDRVRVIEQPQRPVDIGGNKTWVRAAMISASIVIVGALLASRRTAPHRGEVGTSGSGVPSIATEAAPKGRAADHAAPTASQPIAPQHAALTVVLEATDECWVEATADGRRVLYNLLQPGNRRTLSGNGAIGLRIGDAGALKWTINGRQAAVAGQPGQIRTIKITPQNAQTVR